MEHAVVTGAAGEIRTRWLARNPGAADWGANMRIRFANGVIKDIVDIVGEDADPGDGHETLVLPALANAHDHGRGLRCTSYGATDQPLEAWLPLLYQAPLTGGYLNTAVSLCRLARAGVGSVVSCHAMQDPDDLERELSEAAHAANDIGVRLALVIPLRDRNPLVYGSHDAFLAMLDSADRDAVLRNWSRPPLPPRAQVERVRRVAEACDGPLVQVQLGPLAPQWVSDELFACIADDSARSGRRLHMHLLETRYQREWADGHYPRGLLRHLDELGILSDRLTVAHGVWLRPDEMELLAERGVTVSINTCSNLRLRSGLAPVREMLRRGVTIAMGIDGFTIDDDDDAARELRLFRWLHDGPGFEEGVADATLWHAATAAGARAVTGRTNVGILDPGMAADMIAVDWNALTHDAIAPLAVPSELLMARLSRRYIRHVWVAGRQIVHGGSITGIDEAAAEAELLARARADVERIEALRPLTHRYRAALRQFYGTGQHCGTADADRKPQLHS